MTTKRCSGCKLFKDRIHFSKDAYQKDGLRSYCRPCYSSNQKRYRDTPHYRERVRAYELAWRLRNIEKSTRHVDQWRERNSVAVNAHRLAKNAVARGEILRLPCEECGDKKTDAHHDDYSKPLDVRWLCRLHHKRQHIKKKEAAKNENI